ncbi:MAG: zf-HC2 domain-containing protein [Lachnospiraceae bacterium]|nr:zf-HC2 domain-containing protein [Lachnospiraceae bacterium]
MTEECKEIESLMQPYLEDRLSYKELKKFVDHINTCSECKDELEIRFLLEGGLSILENGDTVDLVRIMNERIEKSEERLMNKERIEGFGFLIKGVAMLMLTVCLFLYILG